MKRTGLLIVFLFAQVISFACDVCQKQQPKVLRGISHGAGPQSNWDYVIVFFTGIIVLVALYYSVRLLLNPGENRDDHIKRSIFNVE